ncbi:DUF2125 domain-containing protein [Thalassococcus sp. BH17M4-6]
MLKKLLVAVVVAGLGWSAFWFWQANALRSEIADRFAEARADGWQADYDDLSVGGFPNRLDTTLTGVELRSPDGNTGWSAPFFQVLQLSYKPGHLIAVWPDDHTLIRNGQTYYIAGQNQRGSLVFDAEDRVIRANAEASVLTVTPAEERPMEITGLNAALEQVPADPMAYRLGIQAGTLGAPGQEAPARDMELDLTAHLTGPILTRPGDPPQPRRIELRTLKQTLPPMTLRIDGDLDVDKGGRMDGALRLQASDWRAYLDKTGAGTGPAQDLVRGVVEVVTLMSGGDELDVTLRLDDGQMSVGLLPLGPAPRLRLP